MPGEKELGVAGYENNRHLLRDEDFVHCVKTGASIRKLNVGQDQSRPSLERRADGFLMGLSNCCDFMPKLLDEILDVPGDERLILDDQYGCADLGRNLLSGVSMRLRASRSEQFSICEISFGLKDSIALSKKAIRGSMEMAARFLEAEASSSPIGKSTSLFAGTFAPALQE